MRRLFNLMSVCLVAFVGCDSAKPNSTPPVVQPPAVTPAIAPTDAPTTPKIKPPPISDERVASDQPITVGHIRVLIKKASIGPVPLKQTDGSTSFTKEIRLMVALRIENTSDRRTSPYNTWVPDLEAAKTFAKLVDDKGTELKRVTFGFGNNVRDRTVLDTLPPGKIIGDLLVFESPSPASTYLQLDLPGENCGVKGMFRFRLDVDSISKTKLK